MNKPTANISAATINAHPRTQPFAGRRSPRVCPRLHRTVAVALLWLLTGCAASADGAGYYWQSISGHMKLVNAARPIPEWLADAETPEALKLRLLLAQRMRSYASAELALPNNASYTQYADLKRRAAVYNVVAAPELSLTLERWCFPVVGCVGYRGYFDEEEAKAFAATLPPTLDVAVYPVPAYSTLGWTNWLGGDPLLNTFIGYPEGELARLVFHELAHQLLYVQGDTVFNESFATAVERIGGQRWLAEQAEAPAREAYEAFDARRRRFRALTLPMRERLAALYNNPALSDEEKRLQKASTMANFRRDYEALKIGWGGYAGYDAWVARANNATFGAQAAYDQWVPAFEALYQTEGRNLPRFYDAVSTLSKLEKPERDAALQTLVDAAATSNTTPATADSAAPPTMAPTAPAAPAAQ